MMDNKTRIKRLTELEYMLLNHKKIFKEYGIIFNLNSWATKVCDLAEATFFSRKEGKTVNKESVCGSAACALGSAALYEPFIKQGLKMEVEAVDCDEDLDGELPSYKYEAAFTPVFKGYDDFEAGEKFFGISQDESIDLFDPFSYDNDNPSAKQVATKVRNLINQYKGD